VEHRRENIKNGQIIKRERGELSRKGREFRNDMLKII
jgi:hypothetical protein